VKIRKLLQSPNQGRQVLKNYEWGVIKDSIDLYRAGIHDADDIGILYDFGLWDRENERLDESRITKLYMEYS